jgi:hypothetical protein
MKSRRRVNSEVGPLLFLNEVTLNRKFFIAGFVVGLLAFVAANAYAYHLAIPPCCDATIDFGVPFTLGNYGGYFGGTRFLLGGLFIDGVLAVVASAVFGWLFAIAFPPIIRFLRRARVWHLRTRS